MLQIDGAALKEWATRLARGARGARAGEFRVAEERSPFIFTRTGLAEVGPGRDVGFGHKRAIAIARAEIAQIAAEVVAVQIRRLFTRFPGDC